MYRILRPERNWHMILLLAFAVLNGIAGLLPNLPSSTIEQAFPGFLRYLWYGGLVIGGLGGIVGYLMGMVTKSAEGISRDTLIKWLHRMITGMIMEYGSMWLLTGLCVSYVLGAIQTAQGKALTALGVTSVVAFAIANLARARQLRRGLAIVTAKLDEAMRVQQ